MAVKQQGKLTEMNFRETKPAQGEGDTNHSPRRRLWQNAHVDAHAASLLKRDAAVFLKQSVSTPCLSAIRKAEGIWIEDLSGRRYMDFHGNSVHHIGYGHPKLIAAIREQMDELAFCPRRFTCEPAIRLAEKLAEITPGDLSRVLFAPSGSDAIEIAMALARAATGRFKTLSFWDAYHGTGFGARSISGEAMFRSGKIGPLLAGTEHVPPFGDYRNAWGVTEGSGQLCARQIKYVLEKEGDVAAFIAEPMRAVPYVAPPGFWKEVRAACDATGTLLVFDEIPTGLGKTGAMFACHHEGVTPDILVLGKSLGGGMLPIAATICKPGLDVAQDYAFGHFTHEKSPLGTRAALTTIEIIEEEKLVENAASIGRIGLERLMELMQRHWLIGDVRGRGCLLGVELVEDRELRTPAPDAAEAVMYAALSRGLSFKTTMGNILTLGPPLTITPEEMHRAMDMLDASLTEVESNWQRTR